jgi:hypothetical protein
VEPVTIFYDFDQMEITRLEGRLIWPALGSVVEFGEPNRDGVVRDVRMRLDGGPTVMVYVDVKAKTIPPPLHSRT